MDDEELLNQVIADAKQFENFQNILMAISLHPEWLTYIPHGRIWAILHQVVFSGQVNQLDQLLALQKSNKSFRLTEKTRDGKSVLDIAKLREDVPEMLERIEKLVMLDKMLTNARDSKWDECYEIVKNNPAYLNEKPPYRRYYLINHMGFENNIAEYERFKRIPNCTFNMTVKADKMKVNDCARTDGSEDFAKRIEEEYPFLKESDDYDTAEGFQPSETALIQTANVKALLVQPNVAQYLDCSLLGGSTKIKSRREVIVALQKAHHKQNDAPETTKNVIKPTIKQDFILDNLTCPLTLAVFLDPVVADDGFTYEKSAIETWLQKNNCSPMTNEALKSKDLKPNLIVKQIINAIQSNDQ